MVLELQCKKDDHEKDQYWTLHPNVFPRTWNRNKFLKFHKVKGYKIGVQDESFHNPVVPPWH
jgi:hypothetical protein